MRAEPWIDIPGIAVSLERSRPVALPVRRRFAGARCSELEDAGHRDDVHAAAVVMRADASHLIVHAHGLLELLCAVIGVFATLGEHGVGEPVQLGLDRVLGSTLRVL
jgi:hypothetical protein